MRWQSIGVACMALAACSKQPQSDDRREMKTYDVASPSDATRVTPPTAAVAPSAAFTDNRGEALAPPAIGATAAPGVAFTYGYAFRLPAARVGTVQEQHAQACEKLGVARCRITGMHYRLLGENDVAADLSFKLAPDIARKFGRSGIALVQAAGGTLTDAEITGTDAGAALDRLAVERTRIDAEQRRVDAEIAKGNLKASERAELQRQRGEITRQLAANADTATDRQESLATTPLTFSYGSGPAIRGFDASAPVKSSVDLLLGSAQITLTALLGALALLVPPGLVILLGWTLWRRFRRPRPPETAA